MIAFALSGVAGFPKNRKIAPRGCCRHSAFVARATIPRYSGNQTQPVRSFMRILFIDPTRWQYTVDTPYERPLGGSQSALCYLAAELARLGHSVTVINGTTTELESRGVKLRNLETFGAPGFSDLFDVAIVLNLACGHNLRRDLNVKIPLIFGTSMHMTKRRFKSSPGCANRGNGQLLYLSATGNAAISRRFFRCQAKRRR